MKAMLAVAVAIVGQCLHAQYVDPTVIVNVSTPPRYSLPEGKEVEGQVSRMITMKTGGTKGAINDREPNPKDFETREAFVAAYVNYKRSKAREEDLLKFKGRIGGMENNFRREARNQALKVWDRLMSKSIRMSLQPKSLFGE